MKVDAFFGQGYFDENPFVLTDPATGRSAVVDPCFSGGADFLSKYKIDFILLTHGHVDHMAHAERVRQMTGAKIVAHQAEAQLLETPGLNLSGMFGDELGIKADLYLEDGEELLLGETKIQLLHTPGHTRGSACFLADGHLFTGDTIMAGTVGRTDFPTGNPAEQKSSLEKLKNFSGNLILHCGHGPDTDLDTERRENMFLIG